MRLRNWPSKFLSLGDLQFSFSYRDNLLESQGTIKTGARQKLVLWVEGSRIVIWQS